MKLSKVKIDVFKRIETRFTEETLKEFLNTPVNDVIAKYSTLSSWLKTLILRPKSSIYKYFIKNEIENKQLMADILLIEFYHYKNNL